MGATITQSHKISAKSSNLSAYVLLHLINIYAYVMYIRSFQAYYTPCKICMYGVYTRIYAYAYSIRYTPGTTLAIILLFLERPPQCTCCLDARSAHRVMSLCMLRCAARYTVSTLLQIITLYADANDGALLAATGMNWSASLGRAVKVC
jgi:hypothetical protein